VTPATLAIRSGSDEGFETYPHTAAPQRYGASIVQLQALEGRGRIATLVLAGIVAIAGCSVLSEDPLAIVPPVSRAERLPQQTRRTRVESPVAGTRATHTPTPTSAVLASPLPEAKAEPEPTVLRLRPRPAPGPFSMDLYRPGDFSHQATKDWCVAGSTQTMMNIMRGGRNDHSVRSQERIYLQGRRFSPDKVKLGPIGVDLLGWAEVLNREGFGPYVVDGAGNRRAAIRKAARALRVTGRPVGLVTWRGAHSWVMSGFTATDDPAWRDDYEVTAINIEDTWYPWVSTIWGASRPPGTLVPVSALAEDYLPYQRPRARYPGRDGRFMLILPVLPPETVAR